MSLSRIFGGAYHCAGGGVKQSEHVRVNELNKALEHIDRALKTLAPNREGIEYLSAREDEEMFTRLADVVRAETLISKAVRFLNENFEREFGYKLDPKKLARSPTRARYTFCHTTV
jgi:hypothetical protein